MPQLKLSEGQTWRSEDTGVFSSKSFFTLGSPPLFSDAVTHGTDSCSLLRGGNPLFSLRKVCSSVNDFSLNCGIRVYLQMVSSVDCLTDHSDVSLSIRASTMLQDNILKADGVISLR